MSFSVGQRVRINSPLSQFHGKTGAVSSLLPPESNGSATVRLDGRSDDLCFGAGELDGPVIEPELLWTICDGCKKEIDPTTCGCGDAIDGHESPMEVGHSPIPLGCDCFRVKPVGDLAPEGEAVGRAHAEETPEERWARWQRFFFPPEQPAVFVPSGPSRPAPLFKVGDFVRYRDGSDVLEQQVTAQAYVRSQWVYDLAVFSRTRQGEAKTYCVREELLASAVSEVDKRRTPRR